MTDLEQAQSFISSADAATLNALENAIKQTRAARVDAQNAALPAFVQVVADGHGVPTEVSRETAIELLSKGYKLYSPATEKAE